MAAVSLRTMDTIDNFVSFVFMSPAIVLFIDWLFRKPAAPHVRHTYGKLVLPEKPHAIQHR